MAIIDRVRLRHLLDHEERLRLVHGGGPAEFGLGHIPGSVTFPQPADALRTLSAADRIVIYGRDAGCEASQLLHDLLSDRYPLVDWYRSGFRDWVAAGGPVEGSAPPP